MNMNSTVPDIRARAEIYKLIVAKDSVTQALEVALLLINRGIDHNHELYRPLHDALVVNYGKAFSSMNPFGRIDKKWSAFNEKDSQLAHKRIMDQRNKSVGHRDFIPEGVMIYQIGEIMPGGDVADKVKNEILYKFIAPDDFDFVIKMASDLIDRLSLAISDQMKLLYGQQGELINGTLELITEADAKIMEIENKRLKAEKIKNLS